MFVFYIAVLRLTFLLHHVDEFRQCANSVTFIDHSFSLSHHIKTAQLIRKCVLDIKCLFIVSVLSFCYSKYFALLQIFSDPHSSLAQKRAQIFIYLFIFYTRQKCVDQFNVKSPLSNFNENLSALFQVLSYALPEGEVSLLYSPRGW